MQKIIMHIDMNSYFASVEQQANPFLRGVPVAVCAYLSPRGCIVASSTEAKILGIKTGMRVFEAKQIYSHVIVRDTDPAMVRDVNSKFMKIFQDYSPCVIPKSIDEAVLDFAHCEAVTKQSLTTVAREIKTSIKKEIGEKKE